MRSSFRSTLRRAQSRLEAISSLVWPSIFKRAMMRNDSSGRSPKSRRSSSAVAATTSGVGSVAGELIDPAPLAIGPGQGRLIEDPPAAPLLTPQSLGVVGGLAPGDGDQDAPEVVAVFQPREPAALHPGEEAIEGAQGDVFLVGGRARHGTEPFSGQASQAVEVAAPEPPGGGMFATLQVVDPVGHGTWLFGGHGVTSIRNGSDTPGGSPRSC